MPNPTNASPTNQNAPQNAPNAALVPLGAGGAVALPEALRARLAAAAKDEAAAERPSVSKISLRGGFLSYQGQQIANNVLPCVVLFAGYRNAFYDTPWDPNDIKNPVCFALSEDGEDMEAHENVPDENVGPDSDDKERPTPRSCEGCKYNDWGSEFLKVGSRGKACKETRRLVLLPANMLTDADAVRKAELAILDVPVTSGKNYSNFVNALAAAASAPPWGAVTELSTERDMKTQFKLTFTPKAVIGDAAIFEAIEKKREEAVRLAMTPYDEVSSTNTGKMVDGTGVAAKAAPAKTKF